MATIKRKLFPWMLKTVRLLTLSTVLKTFFNSLKSLKIIQ
jgi:hypothetical protein